MNLFTNQNQRTMNNLSLKNHPFAVEAFFENSTVLTFAMPKEQLQGFIPDCLELDTYQDKWAFIAIALVQTKDLRPKGTPSFLGNDFYLIGYRIFVRYTDKRGKRLRGLYIIKSETNKSTMRLLGNLFTHYNYTKTDIAIENWGEAKSFYSVQSNFEFLIDDTESEVKLPSSSPFEEWKQARRFAGPLPFTFTYNDKTKSILIIEGVRQNWKPKPINVISYNFEFLNSLKLNNVVLASAFEITNIPYYWKKGKLEKIENIGKWN